MPAQSFKLTKSEGVAEGTTASHFTRDTSEGPVCRFDPTTLTMGVDVFVESKIEGINSVVQELMRLLTTNCCRREHEFAVQTALREALANAVIHGNHGDTSKKVRVWCGCDSAKGILIVIRDEGEGFDPARCQVRSLVSVLPPTTEEASFSLTCLWTKRILRTAAERFT